MKKLGSVSSLPLRSESFVSFVVLIVLQGILCSSACAALVITEVMSSSAHPPGSSAHGDWWELTNTGSVGVNLHNYSWDDNHGLPGQTIFPNIIIDAGESILIVDESSDNLPSFKAAWELGHDVVALSRDVFAGLYLFRGLARTGDEVNLYDDADALVTTVNFGTADEGRTFGWDRGGVFLGFSVAGLYGAVVASGNGSGGPGIDVGSPGISVAEPASMTLTGIGLLGIAFASTRRRQFIRRSPEAQT
jgi:hypothetical protein